MSEPRWLTVAQVERLHGRALLRSGGSAGVLNLPHLEGALGRPLLRWRFEDLSLFELAAYYAHGVAKAHAFVDGNKRTAFLAALAFLAQNGIVVRTAPDEAVQAMVALTTDQSSVAAFAAWLARHGAAHRRR